MKRFYAFIAALVFSRLVLMAVPAYPVKKIITLEDGSTVQVTLRGDEFLHYYEAENGACYRQLADGSFARISDVDLSLKREAAMSERNLANKRRALARRPSGSKMEGKKKGLVILVSFPDQPFQTENPQAEFNDFFNKRGYDKHGMTGSVSDYFLAQSYGAFELDFDVVGPYKLSQNMAYYGQEKDGRHDCNPQDMINEAVIRADSDVNFRDYDWDGDGVVDQVFVIYAGYGENYGADSNTIWPHEWSINLDMKFDGMSVYTYACSCELRGTQGAVLDGIGAACHEFSHCLGIYDHYDTQGSNFGMGRWDLMCSGNYNNASCTPASYTAYERWISGWLEPVEVNSMTEIKDMKALVDAPEAYVLYNDGNRDEYYLLENRQNKGFDAYLPSHGLLVVHVDYDADEWWKNTINAGDKQRMTIIPADGISSLKTMEGDPFPGMADVTSLTDYSSPAAIIYNRNTDKSYLMHKPVECISESDNGLISMLLCADPMAVPVINGASDFTPNSFRLSWDEVKGAAGYELRLDEKAKRASVEESLIMDENFESCYSKSAGFTDISKNISNYLTGFSGSKLFTTPDYLRIGTGTTSGNLSTHALGALSTGDLTIVMKVKPYKAGKAVKGDVLIVTNTPETRQSFSFEFDKDTTLVFHSYVNFMEFFRLDIEPSSAMYISGFSLYDGYFSDAELGLQDARSMANRVVIRSFTTEDASYEFTDLNPNCMYSVMLRSYDSRGRLSEWSDFYQVDNPTGVQNVISDVDEKQSIQTSYYDLQGRHVGSMPTKNGIYILDGKKIMVK